MGKDGYVTPELTIRAKRKVIIDNCLEPQPYWDDWHDYRDGFRDWVNDRSRIRRRQPARRLDDERICFIGHEWFDKIVGKYTIRKNNEKLEKILMRRKSMKNKVP